MVIIDVDIVQAPSDPWLTIVCTVGRFNRLRYVNNRGV